MAQQDAFALGRSNLNGFLFAEIGIEDSGMPLSVVSALARQGLDPWQEAGRLARLPRNAAANGLAQLIAAMPASPWPLPDATAIAVRLVALLPGQNADSHSAAGGTVLHTEPQPSGPWLIMAIVTVTLLAGVALLVAPGPAGPRPAPFGSAAPAAPITGQPAPG